MVSKFMSWLRGEDLEPRLERLNAPLDISVREAAGDQIVRWHKGKPGYIDKTIAAYDKDAYRTNALIFACVQYMANAAGSVPARVYRLLDNGQDTEDPDHPLRVLLCTPNAGMGESRFISFVTMVATVAGYCVIEKERDKTGNVIGLWPLRPDWLRPIPRSAGIVDWEYRVPGYAEPFIIEADDAIAVPYGDVPTNDPIGIGPVEVAFRDAGISTSLGDFIARFIENDAMPQYMLIPDMEGKLAAQWTQSETVDAFYAQFKQRYLGRGRERDIIVSPAIKGVERLTMNMNELAYRDLRDVSESAITTAFGIPPILLNTLYGLEHATYSNYAQARRAFWEDKLVPWLARLDDALTRHLMSEFWPNDGYDLRFDLSDVPAMREDENQAHERARQDFTAGLVSRHNAQRMAGIDPHGDDAFLVPFSAVSVPNTGGERSMLALAKASVAQLDHAGLLDIVRAIPALSTPPHIITRDGRRYVNRDAQTPERRAAADRIATHGKQQIGRLADLAVPAIEAFFKEQAGRLTILALRNQPDEYLQGSGDRSVDRHIEALNTVAADFMKRAVENIDWDDEDQRLIDALRQWWQGVSATAFSDIAGILDMDDMWSISNPYLVDLFDMLGYRVRDINETTRQAIETVIRESLVEGTTIPELADNLRDVVEETYKGRAMTTARSESQYGYNLSSQRAYQASAVVSLVQMHDGRDCESGPGSDGLTCPERDGMIVRVEDMQRHYAAEHPNGTLAFSPIVDPLEA